MFFNDLTYQLALTLVPQIGAVQAKILIQHFENATAVFKASIKDLEHIEGIGTMRAKAIAQFTNYEKVATEIAFLERNNIQPLFITNPLYPQRLLNCYDPPAMLYYKGNAPLNASKIVAIVGTRLHTPYGKHLTEQLVASFSGLHVTIVSGLAYGIDAIAHKAAIQHQLPTIGVVAHGLDTIYPLEHSGIAKTMQQNGGLLTEFMSDIKPDKHHFPIRNRIVAGMCDATVVVETGLKGGSMITAELANNYNKDVFAFPGKTTDVKSAGCNDLIRNNKAMLISNGQELIATMGWSEQKKNKKNFAQKSMFIELTDTQQKIVDLLEEKNAVHIDEINLSCGINTSAVAAALLELELQHIIITLPGKMYALQ